MKVSVTKLPKGQAELVIEVTSDELWPYLAEAVAGFSQAADVPGFRPGKAPYDVIKSRVGEMAIYQEAAEKAISGTYPRAVIDNKLLTVGAPKVSVEKLAPGNPFIYKATVALVPQVTLGDYKKIRVGRKAVNVESKDVEETLTNLRKMFGKEKRVTRPAQKGDKVEIDMHTYMDNVPLDGGESKGHPVMIGEGHFIPGFEDNLIGLAENQTKEFELKFPKEYHRKELAGKPANFKVTAKNIFEIELPPLDDSFAKIVGRFEKLDEVRTQIEKNIHEEKTVKERQRWELAMISEIVNKSSFEELADILIESELHKMLHEMEHDVTEQGMKFENYLTSIKKSRDDLEKEFRPQAIKRVQTALALRAIADQEHITVGENEIDQEIEQQKVKNSSNAEAVKQINTDEYRDYLRNVMRSRKVFEWLEKLPSN